MSCQLTPFQLLQKTWSFSICVKKTIPAEPNTVLLTVSAGTQRSFCPAARIEQRNDFPCNICGMQFIFVSKVITACDQLHQAFTPQGDASYCIYLFRMSTSCGFNANKTITNAPWPHSFQFQPYHLKGWRRQTKRPSEILYYSLSPVRRRQADL